MNPNILTIAMWLSAFFLLCVRQRTEYFAGLGNNYHYLP